MNCYHLLLQDIKKVAPGAKKTVALDIYKGSMNPETVALFRRPLPDPEDRYYYFEFGESSFP
jgi:hypothetical protein